MIGRNLGYVITVGLVALILVGGAAFIFWDDLMRAVNS